MFLSVQVRSLGSVALRKAESAQGGLHFNVFTVDFNEELVAMYGGSLRRQTLFLRESIKAILKLYKVGPQMLNTCHLVHVTGPTPLTYIERHTLIFLSNYPKEPKLSGLIAQCIFYVRIQHKT